MEQRKVQKLYVLSASEAFVNKANQDEKTDLLHGHLTHVNSNRLKVMMKKNVNYTRMCLAK